MHDVARWLRRAVEAIVPWFDRAEADRERRKMQAELAASRKTREAARQVIASDIARRYQRYDRVVRR